MSYATTTSVPVERTLGEIQGLLIRRGADEFAFQTSGKVAHIGFTMGGKRIKFTMTLPDKASPEIAKTPPDRRGVRWSRTPLQVDKAYGQALRSKWRTLLLCIKAKLEVVDSGITTFEYEFLAHFVAANGKTIAESLLPRLKEICDGSNLLTFSDDAKPEPPREMKRANIVDIGGAA